MSVQIPSKQLFRNRNVDLKALVEKIVDYFYAREFDDVDVAEDRKGGWYEIQALKKFGYFKALRVLGPRESIHVIVRGEPNEFEVMIGTGAKGVFVALGGALNALSYRGFEEDLWEYIKRQIVLVQLGEAIPYVPGAAAPPSPVPQRVEPRLVEEVTVPLVGPMRANLYCSAGPQMGQNFPLYKDVVFLGRARDSDVLLTDYTVSRKHAKIVYDGAKYYVEDMGSKNHTYVNGEILPAGQRRTLTEGSELRLGANTTLKFTSASGAEETRPA